MVISIMLVLMTMSVVVFRSLIDSFSINEVSLTIAQDIRSTQRAAMLLDRESDERWLYGIGIDFSRIKDDREYKIFKWCSPYNYYDEKQTRLIAELPNYTGGDPSGVQLPFLSSLHDCNRGTHGNGDNGLLVIETKSFKDYDNLKFEINTSLPAGQEVRYILFESVSGKAFFYNSNGNLLNYSLAVGNEIRLNNPFSRFILKLTPIRSGAPGGREMNVLPVSGRVFFKYD